ncbi:MAG TPA: hypothetical protein VL523_14350 [Terriglobia bacterium]|nr:hypothetical protein [Terriglobia bacterium]
MRRIGPEIVALAATWVMALNALGAAAQAVRRGATLPSESLACKVMEAKEAAAVKVTAVLFHQAGLPDREHLGEWLRNNDGASVEFETSDGRWHPATVFRLRNCFGRGLLVFAAQSAHLEEGTKFLLRLPEGGVK